MSTDLGGVYLTELNQALPMYGNPITTAASTDSRSVASASEKTSIKSDSEAECSSQPDSSGDDDYDDDDDDDDMVLKKAGVKLQLGDLQGQEKAPLTLLTEVGYHGNQTGMLRLVVMWSHGLPGLIGNFLGG